MQQALEDRQEQEQEDSLTVCGELEVEGDRKGGFSKGDRKFAAVKSQEEWIL